MAGHQAELSFKKLAVGVWSSGETEVWANASGGYGCHPQEWSDKNRGAGRAGPLQSGSLCYSLELAAPTPPHLWLLPSFIDVYMHVGSEPSLSIPGTCSVTEGGDSNYKPPTSGSCLGGRICSWLPPSESQETAAPFSLEAKQPQSSFLHFFSAQVTYFHH